MKKQIYTVLCCALLCSTVFGGCGNEALQDKSAKSDQQDQSVHLEDNRDIGIMGNGSTTQSDPYGFLRHVGIKLFDQALQEGENTLISPLSICGSLILTAQGAEGKTQSQIVHLIQNTETSWSLNILFNNYVKALPQDDRYKLRLANSIWIKDTPELVVNKVYLDNYLVYYDAEVNQAPFDESTLAEINSWVEEKTDGMIPEMLNDVLEDAMMYLVNALAFDAEWQTLYNETQIRKGIFTAGDGTEQNAEMMYSKENIYLEDEGAVGFLKYYADEKYAFVALLPNEGTSVADYVASLNENPYYAVWKLLRNTQETTVNAAIPKFECSYDISLQDTLTTLGMVDAFDPDLADFSFICKTVPLYISEVLHKTYIAVDERGTKAGASTAVVFEEEGASVSKDEKNVYLDRPFLYMIIDCEEKIPLFIGTLDHLE